MNSCNEQFLAYQVISKTDYVVLYTHTLFYSLISVFVNLIVSRQGASFGVNSLSEVIRKAC